MKPFTRHIDMKFVTIGLLLLPLVSCPQAGQRLLHIEIELDGKVVYTGMRGVPDRTPVMEMWNVLPEVPFEESPTPAASEEAKEEKSRILNGRIVVRIRHVKQELDSASLASLTITRNGGGSKWFLSRAQAERVKHAAKK